MDSRPFDTGAHTIYSLWHIPSSTLLVSTGALPEVRSQVQGALSGGCLLEDLMLQITGQDDLIGQQHLGSGISLALRQDDDPGPALPGACESMPVG